MRYRDTGDYQNSGMRVDDNSVFYSILLGIILGVGLVLANLYYFVMRSMGYV